jgi:hypothetical protein
MNEKAEAAKKYGGQWSGARWVTMVGLIVLSAIVAAEKTLTPLLTWAPPDAVQTGIAVCSLLVAIGTAFDQGVKPGTRWRLSAGYSEKFSGLKREAQRADPTDRAVITKLDKDYLDLVQKWLEDTTE